MACAKCGSKPKANRSGSGKTIEAAKARLNALSIAKKLADKNIKKPKF